MYFSIFTLIIACVGQNVRPGADGLHSVGFLTDNSQFAPQSALRQAKRYCKRTEKKGFAVQEESLSYICEMNERRYIQAKKAAAAAEMAGAAMEGRDGTVGEESEGKYSQYTEPLADILIAGGAIADESLGDCYAMDMTFQCM